MKKSKYFMLTLIVSFCLSINFSALGKEKENSNPNGDFLDKTISKFRNKCKNQSGIDYLNCWAKYSPERCKPLVYMQDKGKWAKCVFSCGSESFFTKTFGDCSN